MREARDAEDAGKTPALSEGNVHRRNESRWLATLRRDVPVAGKQIRDANVEADMDPNLIGFIGLAALMVCLVVWLRAAMNGRMDRVETAQAEPPGRIETIPSGHDATLSGTDATLSGHGERLTRIETVQNEQGEHLARIEATLSEQGECLTRIEAALSEHGATDRESELDRERFLREAAARSKYAPLYRHLSAICDEEWRASFEEIEAVLEFRLPDSAYLYPAWWSNGGRSQALAWLAAGWRTRSIDLEDETLVFERMAPARPDPDGGDLWWE